MTKPVAEYYVLEDMFIAPTLIKAGSTIRFDGVPGPHLAAMNDEADRRLEAYFNEHPTLKPVGPTPVADADVVHIVKEPPKNLPGEFDLANVRAAPPREQAPPPPVEVMTVPARKVL